MSRGRGFIHTEAPRTGGACSGGTKVEESRVDAGGWGEAGCLPKVHAHRGKTAPTARRSGMLTKAAALAVLEERGAVLFMQCGNKAAARAAIRAERPTKGVRRGDEGRCDRHTVVCSRLMGAAWGRMGPHGAEGAAPMCTQPAGLWQRRLNQLGSGLLNSWEPGLAQAHPQHPLQAARRSQDLLCPQPQACHQHWLPAARR